MSDITDALDEFGWFNGRLDSPEKQSILFRWMQEVTLELDRQRTEIDTIAKFVGEHETNILKLAELQGKMISLSEKDTENLNRLIELVKQL